MSRPCETCGGTGIVPVEKIVDGEATEEDETCPTCDGDCEIEEDYEP